MADLSIADVFARFDATEARASGERTAQADRFSSELRQLRAENRWLTGLLVAGILALAGVQVSFGADGVSTTPAEAAPVAAEAPAAEAMPPADEELPALPDASEAQE